MSQKSPIPPEGPGQAQIEALLESFRPQPGEQFYRRMADAPWTKKGTYPLQPMNHQSLSRALAVSVFVLLLLGIVAVMTPRGQALVRNVLQPLAPNKSGVVVPPTQGNQLPTESLESQSAPAQTAQAVEQVAFEICGESNIWTRPSEEEQKTKWWDFGRYAGGDEKVIKYPWTHDFFVAYGSASIEYDIINLSGLWTLPGNVRDNCLGSDQQEAVVALKTAEVWVLLHTVKSIYRTGTDYYVVVEPTEKGVQFVQFSRPEQQVPLTLHFVTEGSQEVERIAEAESPYWPYPQLALSATPTTTPGPMASSLTASEAEAMAGFALQQPAKLPRGYSFGYATYEAEARMVCLHYFFRGSPFPTLFIRQSPSVPLTPLKGRPKSTPETQIVQIGGAADNSSQYVTSFEPPQNACNKQSDIFRVNEALLWQAQGLSFEIYAQQTLFTPDSLSRMELIRLAESITGVSTIPEGQLDPEHLNTVEEVKALTGFDIKKPANLPQGYTFEHARYENQAAVVLLYSSSRSFGNMLIVYECPIKEGARTPCAAFLDQIPNEVRVPVEIGDVVAMYAKGSLGRTNEAEPYSWYSEDPDRTQRLYWQTDGWDYLIWGTGDPPLEKDALVAVAEGMLTQPQGCGSLAWPTCTVSEAEALAGFDVLAPSYLPTGYTFQGAHYDSETQRVAMRYISQPGDSGGAGAFYIYQQHGRLPEDTTPSAAVTPVPVGDVMGTFVRGAWVYEPAGSTTPRWEGNADVYTLSWQKGNTTFIITFLGGETIPPISLDDLRAIAESLK